MIRNWSNIISKFNQFDAFFFLLTKTKDNNTNFSPIWSIIQYNLLLFRKRKWTKIILISYYYRFSIIIKWVKYIQILNYNLLFLTGYIILSIIQLFFSFYFNLFYFTKLKNYLFKYFKNFHFFYINFKKPCQIYLPILHFNNKYQLYLAQIQCFVQIQFIMNIYKFLIQLLLIFI